MEFCKKKTQISVNNSYYRVKFVAQFGLCNEDSF